jgi:putative ribosome biogenesis GTPase RsgA
MVRVPIRTFVHPSVFLLLDCVLNFNINRESLGLNENLLNYQAIIIPHPDQVFWKHHFTATSYIDKVRILVCGNNGVGKSSLINKVFGEVVVRALYHVTYVRQI